MARRPRGTDVALRTRAVLVHRRTELDELLDRHATRGQAEFFLRTRGRTLAEVEARHEAAASARRAVAASVPSDWALAEVERADLDRFLFAPEDVVLVVGQDGLVANAAKYLDQQLVVGVNPEPGANLGVLVRHEVESVAEIIDNLAAPQGGANQASFAALLCDELTMVHARLDDGQELRAVNELFLGHPSHQSARYTLAVDGGSERQSSSGLIVSTGTGATGWCASIAHDRGGRRLPEPTDPALAWFVREAWPSPITGVTMTEGVLDDDRELVVTVQSDRLVVFGDGMEADRLEVSWGQEVRIGVAERRLRLL
ncbi:NAD kinase [Promicromonospora sp. AC04]|nr:NAD kinase [Promicromonospora sp. AC04]